MDDIKLALLGNKEAAKRLTDAGVLLPCPGCRGEDTKHRAVMACVVAYAVVIAKARRGGRR